MRKARFAGSFYPAGKKELEKEVLGFLGEQKKEKLKAVIVPHAGYYFSGKLAGEVISRIKKKKTFIILGTNHSGLGNKINFSFEDFETALGIVRNNKELGEKILDKLKKEIDSGIDEESHNSEHSIEVHLPFLQLSQKDFEIVPILLKDLRYEECRKIAEIISEFVDDACIIVSGDFTHYGYNYGFVPFKENIKENLCKLDKEIIQEILNLNSKKVYELAGKSTVCGIYGFAILTEIAKIKKWKVKLIDYYTSGDIVGDWGNAVGYAGIIFG